MNRQAGFTLVEMLIVMAILGLLMALGIPNVVNDLRKQRLAMGTQDVASLITSARTQASSQNRCTTMTFGSPTGFTIQRYSDGRCATTVESSTTVNYSPSMTLTAVNASSVTATTSKSVTFISPYGTNGEGTALDLTFTSTANSNLTRDMRITGVLGTVIMK